MQVLVHLISLVLICIPFTLQACPPREALRPCTCHTVDYSSNIVCSGLDNHLDLMNAVSSMKGIRDIYSFTIQDSSFIYIPHDAFQGVQFMELEIKTSSLMALTDTNVALEGLEDHLDILLITDCTFMSGWDWSMLKNLKKLMRLDIVEGDLLEIGEELSELNARSLKDISFAKNRISHLHSSAFASFTDLEFLTLNDNYIVELERSMMPNPALKLRQIVLSNNEIEQLPDDLFENMPALELISIDSNKILKLNGKTFTPVWEQLQDFSAMRNDLRCDCRLSWITKMKFPKNTRAVCSQPAELRGKNINTLSSKDLWC